MRKWKLGRLLPALLLCVSLAAPALAATRAPLRLTAQEQAYFADHDVLRVLMPTTLPPYSGEDGGTAADILQRLCTAAGVRLEPVWAESYEDAARSLEQGEAELSAAVYAPAVEADRFVPYLRTPIQIVMHKDVDLSLERNFLVVQLAGIDLLDLARYPQLETTSLPTVSDCLYAVRSRQGDLYACDLYMLAPFLERIRALDLEVINLPQYEAQVGFALPQGADPRLRSALERTVASFSTTELSRSLMAHQHQHRSDLVVRFVYRHPFELLCALASVFFVLLISLMVYTKVRLAQHQELRGYEDSYRMLADTFGEAGMEYDFLNDRLTLFGQLHHRLDLPETVEGLHGLLAERALRISLTPEELDALLENRAPGRSYEVELQCGMAAGDWSWFRMIYVVVCTSESHRRPIRLIGCLVNIDQEHQEREHLLNIGRSDQLTGLLNRTAAQGEIDAALATGTPSLLLFLDIDRFKLFNDHYGHLCGDAVLVALGSALRVSFPDGILSRWGGDEFLVFLPGAGADPDQVLPAVHLLQAALQAFSYRGHPLPVTLSIGGAVSGPESTLEDLLTRADTALYAVKNSGRDSYALSAAAPTVPREGGNGHG